MWLCAESSSRGNQVDSSPRAFSFEIPGIPEIPEISGIPGIPAIPGNPEIPGISPILEVSMTVPTEFAF